APPGLTPDDRAGRAAVEPEERHRLCSSLLDIAVDHQPARVRDLVRQEQVDVAEVPREERPPEDVGDRDAAASQILLVLWCSVVVELTLRTGDDEAPLVLLAV